jgi:uncharacterized protein (DUF58 family)
MQNVERITLQRKRIYIMPTANGWMFALILLVILIGAVNYGNSLAFMLCFLLTSMSLVSILHTYHNMAGLSIQAGQAEAQFVGQNAYIPLWFNNHQHAARYALNIQISPEKTKLTAPLYHLDLAANAYQRLDIKVELQARGWQPLGRMCISSIFPLGLFRAWSYIKLNQATVLAYPKISGHKTLPQGKPATQGQAQEGQYGNEDFSGYRPYMTGDSPRHVDWKAVARERGWWTKQFTGGMSTEICWLYWQDVQHYANIEQALSQLSCWVAQAEKQQYHYGLSLPQHTIEPNLGQQHQAQCLRVLALFRNEN